MPLSCNKNLQSTTGHDNLLLLARDGMEMHAWEREDKSEAATLLGCSGLGVRAVPVTVKPVLPPLAAVI